MFGKPLEYSTKDQRWNFELSSPNFISSNLTSIDANGFVVVVGNGDNDSDVREGLGNKKSGNSEEDLMIINADGDQSMTTRRKVNVVNGYNRNNNERIQDFNDELAGSSFEPDEENDLISLVFWYKDDNPTPIYTLDARQVSLSTNSLEPNATNDGDKKSLNESIRKTSSYGQLRNRQLLLRGKHYSSIENNREFYLEISKEYPVIKLIFDSSKARDSGKYKCRIDFRRTRTISQIVGLLVEGKSTSVYLFSTSGSYKL